MDRRKFLIGSVAGLAGAAVPTAFRAGAWAQTATSTAQQPTMLMAVSRSLNVNGKQAKVLGLVRKDGSPGIRLEPGQPFNVALTNSLSDPTLIHWHGMTPPWPLDGVPDNPAPLIKAGETRTYAFPVVDPGTYWMHAHTLQEQGLLAAPLIVHDAADAGKDEQEVVVLLHDFSFTPAEELLARLKKGGRSMPMDMGGMNMSGMNTEGMSRADMMKHIAQMATMMDGMKPKATRHYGNGPQRRRI